MEPLEQHPTLVSTLAALDAGLSVETLDFYTECGLDPYELIEAHKLGCDLVYYYTERTREQESHIIAMCKSAPEWVHPMVGRVSSGEVSIDDFYRWQEWWDTHHPQKYRPQPNQVQACGPNPFVDDGPF